MGINIVMNLKTDPAERGIIQEAPCAPAVTVIMPFEPKMGRKTELSQALEVAAEKVERELRNNYPGEIVTMVMEKLKKVISGLNFNTHKKSIAIYISPIFEKILYLDTTKSRQAFAILST